VLEVISGLPEQVLGLKAVGKVSAGDYAEVVVPAIAERLARYSKLRLLYLLGDEFTGFTPGAAWADAKLGMKHFTAFERIAIVTDKEWVESLVQAMGFVLPGEVETFANHEYAKAREWIAETASRGKLDFELLKESGVLVLEPQDELEAADFERVAAVVDPYIVSHGGLSGIVVVTEKFPGWDDFAAMTAHFRFVREHHDKVQRVALVTSDRFLAALPRLAARFVAAEVRHFPLEEREQAIEWVVGAVREGHTPQSDTTNGR
jgi:hypothetical protein